MTNHSDSLIHGAQSKAIHAGEQPDAETGASTPNLVMSSTFTVDQALSFSVNEQPEDPPYIYGRWANPTVNQLEQKLAALDNAQECVCFGSGMAAASAVFTTFLSAGDHLVVGDINYAGVAELVRDTLPRFGIEVSIVDTSKVENVERVMRDTTRLFWLETPCNPILRLSDIRAIGELCKSANCLLAIDSTFATPIATRPLELGADLVMHSLTKYIGGHGDALGGSVAGSSKLISELRKQALVHGGSVLSPFNAWLIMRGAATLPLRMKAHQENAMKVAEFLSRHPAVLQVNYPGLSSHPQHELAQRQMDNYSGMMCFQVADGETLSRRMMSDLKMIHYAVSLGHIRSLIYWMSVDDLNKSSFRLSGEQLESFKAYAGNGVFRLSVGLEDGDDICNDLESILEGAG